jgi:hypothetical protein
MSDRAAAPLVFKCFTKKNLSNVLMLDVNAGQIRRERSLMTGYLDLAKKQ